MLIFGLISIHGISQNSNCLFVEGIKDRYDSANYVIVFNIINVCDTIIKFNIQYQKFIDDKWVSIWDDIDRNYFSKKSRVFIISNNNSISVKWNAIDYPMLLIKEDNNGEMNMYIGTFRFAFYIPKNKQKEEDIFFYTKQFCLE